MHISKFPSWLMQWSSSEGCIGISSGLLVPICSRLDFMSLDLFCAQLHNLPICLLLPGQFGANQIFNLMEKSFQNPWAIKGRARDFFYFISIFLDLYLYINCIVNLFSRKDFPSDCITDRAGNQAERVRIRISIFFGFVYSFFVHSLFQTFRLHDCNMLLPACACKSQ